MTNEEYELYMKKHEAEEEYDYVGWLSQAADKMLACKFREMADEADAGEYISTKDMLELCKWNGWRAKAAQRDVEAAETAAKAKHEYDSFKSNNGKENE